MITDLRHNHVSRPTLDGRGCITRISFVLVDSERFSGDTGLINLDDRFFTYDFAVCRNNIALGRS
jgi:hypothetical protein